MNSNDDRLALEEHFEPSDIELGEDVTNQFEIRRPVGVVLSVRVSRHEAMQLEEIAQQAGISVIDLVRQSLQTTIARGTTGSAPSARTGS